MLSNAEKRKLYDEEGEEGLKTGGEGGGGFDPFDIFNVFFGGRSGRGPRGGGASDGPRKGRDTVHQLSVGLEDLYNGATRKLAIQKNVLCTKCNGTGAQDGMRV